MTEKLNAREELEAAQTWLAYQNEDLSFGLKSGEDGLKLWRYWMARPELPEFCDECEDAAERKLIVRHTKAALGYDPWKRAAQSMA